MSEFSVIIAELKAKIDELENLNQQFFIEVGNLEETEGALQGMWEGEAKESFHSAFSTDVVQMHNFYNAIRAYVEVLQTILANYQQAEATNIEIANTRSYR